MMTMMRTYPGHLPRAGGLEDQDALLSAAIALLTEERYEIELSTRDPDG